MRKRGQFCPDSSMTINWWWQTWPDLWDLQLCTRAVPPESAGAFWWSEGKQCDSLVSVQTSAEGLSRNSIKSSQMSLKWRDALIISSSHTCRIFTLSSSFKNFLFAEVLNMQMLIPSRMCLHPYSLNIWHSVWKEAHFSC